MTFFEMFGTVASALPVKKCLSIPLREVYLLSNFGRGSSSTSINMTDKSFSRENIFKNVIPSKAVTADLTEQFN